MENQSNDKIIDITESSDLDSVLDDKLLDAVTPQLALLDDEDNNSNFCTRCHTISSSLLTSHVCNNSSYAPSNSNASQELCRENENYPKFYSPNPREDVPLIGVSIPL